MTILSRSYSCVCQFPISAAITSKSFRSAKSIIKLTCSIDATPEYIFEVFGFMKWHPTTSLAFLLPSYFTSNTKCSGRNLCSFGMDSLSSCGINILRASMSLIYLCIVSFQRLFWLFLPIIITWLTIYGTFTSNW